MKANALFSLKVNALFSLTVNALFSRDRRFKPAARETRPTSVGHEAPSRPAEAGRHDLAAGFNRRSFARRSSLLFFLAASSLFLPVSVFAAVPGPARADSPVVVGLFWALALLTIASGAGVAFSRNIVYASFSLLGAFLGVSGLYVFLSADFLAIAQVLIYIGGVLVLILFAVMLTSKLQHIRFSNPAIGMLPASLAAIATTALLLFVAIAAPWRSQGHVVGMHPTASELGDLLLTRYLLPFEVASVVLLATLVGAVVVARKEIKPN